MVQQLQLLQEDWATWDKQELLRKVEYKRREHERYLRYLYEHMENPLFQCRFRWRENSIAFWDNRCAQHRAMWDYCPHTRSGNRVTVAGDKPF